MESDDMNCLCRLCGIYSENMIDVLNGYETKQPSAANETNILEIIHNCLPVQISNFDGLPKMVCESCCDKSRYVYEFIQLILTTQKMFLKNLDDIELIKTNKNKVVQLFAMDDTEKTLNFSQINYSKPSRDSAAQQVFENLRKTRTNVTISKVKCSKPTESQASEKLILVEPEPLALEPDDNPKIVELIDNNQTSDVEDEETANDETNQIIEYYEEYLNDFDTPNEEPPSEELDEVIDEKECESPSSPTKSTTATTTSSLIVQPVNATTTKSTNKPTVVKMMCEASFVCMTCKINVNTFEELRIHMKTNVACKKIHTTCETCGKCCDSKKSLYQHTLTHKQKNAYVCEECGKVYTNRFNLENHKSSFHGEQVEEYGSVYKCKICDDQFTNRKDLYDHLSNHRKMPSVNLCETCGKCFDYPEQLRSHVRIHSDHRPFPCTYCDKRFRSRLQQLQHLHVHNGEKQFICLNCGKEFAKRGSLLSHSRLHSGETPFACTQCDEKFTSPGKLKTHVKYHSVEEKSKNE